MSSTLLGVWIRAAATLETEDKHRSCEIPRALSVGESVQNSEVIAVEIEGVGCVGHVQRGSAQGRIQQNFYAVGFVGIERVLAEDVEIPRGSHTPALRAEVLCARTDEQAPHQCDLRVQ